MPVGASFEFDAKNKRAARLARVAAGKLVTNITNETLLSIRTLIQKVIRDGVPPHDAARMVLGVIGQPGATTNEAVGMAGLHHIQVVAAMNYRQTLIDMGHTPSMVERLFDKYVKRKLRERATTIARTETVWSLTKGAEAQYIEAVRQGFLPANGRLRWVTTPDEKLCDFCGPMHNRTKPIAAGHGSEGEATYFLSPQGPIEGPPRHPNCRCTIVFAETKTPVDASAGVVPAGQSQAGPGAWRPKAKPGEPIPDPVYEAAGITHDEVFDSANWPDEAIEMIRAADKGLKAALKRLNELGVDVSGTRVSYHDASPAAERGAFISKKDGSGTVQINIGPDLSAGEGWTVRPGPEAVVIHEFGHQQHWKQFLALRRPAVLDAKALDALETAFVRALTATEELIARQVSRYAGVNTAEFVAEVYTGLAHGVRYGADVMALYRRLAGPTIPGVLG